MKITYDKKINALNISFKKGTVFESVEINSNIIADLDKKGNLLYLEILDVGKNFNKNEITRFLKMRKGVPFTTV